MGCIVLIVVGDARAYFGASSRYFGNHSIKKALILKKYTDFAMKVLVYYYKYLNTFLQKKS